MQRNPGRAVGDAFHDIVGETRGQPRNQLSHRLIIESGQVHQQGAPTGGAPIGATFEEVGSCEDDHENRVLGRPLDEFLDEVEEPFVGPVEVLEDHRHGAAFGDALEERAQRRIQLAAITRRHLAEADDRGEPGLDPPLLILVRGVLSHGGAELQSALRIVLGLDDACPFADHLAKRPEGDAFAVGG